MKSVVLSVSFAAALVGVCGAAERSLGQAPANNACSAAPLLTAEEVTAMSHEERVMLLKDQILQFTQEVLGYDTFEIRLRDPETSELLPLLECLVLKLRDG